MTTTTQRSRPSRGSGAASEISRQAIYGQATTAVRHAPDPARLNPNARPPLPRWVPWDYWLDSGADPDDQGAVYLGRGQWGVVL